MRQQRDVPREFAERRGKHAEDRGDVAEPVALRVPRHVAHVERQVRRKRLGHRDAAIAERRQRARCAAELDDEHLPARRCEPQPVSMKRTQNACELTPSDRQRLLQPRPAGEHGRGVAPRLAGEYGGEPVDVGFDQRERIAQLQHEARIDDILARRAPVHVAFRLRCRRCDLARQRGDERDRQVARLARVARDRRDVESVGRAFACDRIGGRARDDADARLRLRERRFEVEHPRDARAVREDVAHRVGCEQ